MDFSGFRQGQWLPAPPDEPLALGWGAWVMLTFKTPVRAIGVEFFQGLWPTLFGIRIGPDEYLYQSATYGQYHFLGFAFDRDISDIRFQTQVTGHFSLARLFLFTAER